MQNFVPFKKRFNLIIFNYLALKSKSIILVSKIFIERYNYYLFAQKSINANASFFPPHKVCTRVKRRFVPLVFQRVQKGDKVDKARAKSTRQKLHEPSRAWLTMQGFIHCSPTWLGNYSPLDSRRVTTGQWPIIYRFIS